jgi:hypothetical protein
LALSRHLGIQVDKCPTLVDCRHTDKDRVLEADIQTAGHTDRQLATQVEQLETQMVTHIWTWFYRKQLGRQV